ncbi:hypothetical protein K474DRAFT_1679242 [Panus rudis PR-1116 ss-1]|nr:hypothetical protein K474DRAFT_1679242 [Panus rudis PR-1116 ss-1]
MSQVLCMAYCEPYGSNKICNTAQPEGAMKKWWRRDQTVISLHIYFRHYGSNKSVVAAVFKVGWVPLDVRTSRQRRLYHLLNPVIDRPWDALPHLKAFHEMQEKRICRLQLKEPGWQSNPLVYAAYSDALMFTNQFTHETKTMLERVLVATRKLSLTTRIDFTYVIFKAKAHLALLLQQMGVEVENQREYKEFCTHWLKKNPTRISAKALLQLLCRSNQPVHPVLEALGGRSWLVQHLTGQNAVTSKTEQRQTKHCRNCGKLASECIPLPSPWPYELTLWTLFIGRDSARAKELAAQLKVFQPQLGQEASDWNKFRESHMKTTVLASALGLQKDPSRGRTHIILREVEYRPKASKDWRHRFHTRRMGVFRIKEILKDIATLMGMEPGEVERLIQEMYDEVDSAGAGKDAAQRSQKAPILDVTWGDVGEPWIGSVAVTLDALRRIPYDPEWRKSINFDKQPPAPLVPRSGVKDAEHDSGFFKYYWCQDGLFRALYELANSQHPELKEKTNVQAAWKFSRRPYKEKPLP